MPDHDTSMTHRRPWGTALLGSAAVAIAVAVVVATAPTTTSAVITIIAVVTIAVIALWSARSRASCARQPAGREGDR